MTEGEECLVREEEREFDGYLPAMAPRSETFNKRNRERYRDLVGYILEITKTQGHFGNFPLTA